MPLPDLGFLNPAPAQLSDGEKAFLYSFTLNYAPHRVLEIGSYRGGSALIIAKALDWNDRGRLICVDPHGDFSIDWKQIAHRAELVLGRSPWALPEAARRAGGPFDLCFIDANHSEQAVWMDFVGAVPHMAPGGYVLFHDAQNAGVSRAIRDGIAACTGVVDCGLIGRYVEGRETHAPNGPWGGFHLVRVRNPRAFRWPRRLVKLRRAFGG